MENLKEKIRKFEEVERARRNKILEPANAKRQEFTEKFSLNKLSSMLSNMSYDEYVSGKPDSFCYWLDTTLRPLGEIRGSFASKKFGIYFNGSENDYVYLTKFGDSKEQAFQNILTAIISLIEDGNTDNIESLILNPISPMFKGKILATYYPKKYLNVFSNDILNKFLKNLVIISDKELNEIEKRKILTDYKNKNEIMKNWELPEFGDFLFYSFSNNDNEWNNFLEKCEKLYKTESSYINQIINENQNKDEKPELKLNPLEKNGTKYYPTDPNKKEMAKKKANYCCEYNNEHVPFVSTTNKRNFVEGHHLIPMAYQDDFEKNLDVLSNIVSLCPNCHRAIHHSIDKENLLKKLYEERKDRLVNQEIIITFDELKNMYM